MFGFIIVMVVMCIVLLLVLPWADPYLERFADWLEADPIGNKIGGWYDQYLSWVNKKQRKALRDNQHQYIVEDYPGTGNNKELGAQLRRNAAEAQENEMMENE